MDVTRIDAYDDQRFSRKALLQHGAFLMDDIPAEVVITGSDTAVVRCPVPDAHDALIDEFRFYAEHITRFTDEAGSLLRTFPPVERFFVALDDIQPSQFYADEDKLRAVRSFVNTPEDVVVPLVQYQGRYVSLDGHTRMVAARELGFTHVTGFLTQADAWLFRFAEEAVRRSVISPADITILPHDEYCIKWHRFCDEFFSGDA